MTASNDLSCTVYIDTELSLDAVATAVSKALTACVSGPAFSKTIQTPAGEFEVRRNSDSDAARATQFPDGFLFFRYRLEFYPGVDVPREAQIAAISCILPALWSQGIAAVAACDYEDELPHRGGSSDRSLPWASGDGLAADRRDLGPLPEPGAVQP
jgi:hypothetical protein